MKNKETKFVFFSAIKKISLILIIVIAIFFAYLICTSNIDSSIFYLTGILFNIFILFYTTCDFILKYIRDDEYELIEYAKKLESVIIPNKDIKDLDISDSCSDTSNPGVVFDGDVSAPKDNLSAIFDEEDSEGMNVENKEHKTNQIDALRLMLINLENIKEFYRWSQKQAKASFILAFIMCIFGFILMTVAILLPIRFNLSFQMSIIPAIGGVITELVAGTVLVVYKSSLTQLNHYHMILHEDERFLSSVNLLEKFSRKEEQDEMLKKIINSEIQMNLDELNIKYKISKRKDK